jgi:hypothetical protein
MEIWKKIKGYEDSYEVSNLGNVRSITRLVERTSPAGKKCLYTYNSKILNSVVTNKGYLRLGLYNNDGKSNHQVHRLVALTFINNPNNKEQVNHINGIKTDNRVVNLEWVSNYENFRHSVNMGLQENSHKNGGKRKIQ